VLSDKLTTFLKWSLVHLEVGFMSVTEECEKNFGHFRKENLLVDFGLTVRLYLPRLFNRLLLKIFMHFGFLHFTPQEHFFLGRLPFFLHLHICFI
jgi:hypothetical protein